MDSKATEFINAETSKNDKRIFAGSIITILVAYAGISFLLNSIRATASLWLVWPLIAIQLLLYFFIFYNSYQRSKALGLHKNLALILFIILAVLGRVENWEIVILPLLVVAMIVVSSMKSGKSVQI